jgi:hypothetical protein
LHISSAPFFFGKDSPMLETVIGNGSMPFILARPGANSTEANFAARVPQVANPALSGAGAPLDGFIEFGGLQGTFAKENLLVVPYGVGSDTNTFSMSVWGWTCIGDANDPLHLWVPVLLAGFTLCTLSADFPGVAGTYVPATALFCDTMTLTYGTPASGSDVALVAPGDVAVTLGVGMAHARVKAKGFRYLEVGFSIASGSTTSMNALCAKF